MSRGKLPLTILRAPSSAPPRPTRNTIRLPTPGTGITKTSTAGVLGIVFKYFELLSVCRLKTPVPVRERTSLPQSIAFLKSAGSQTQLLTDGPLPFPHSVILRFGFCRARPTLRCSRREAFCGLASYGRALINVIKTIPPMRPRRISRANPRDKADQGTAGFFGGPGGSTSPIPVCFRGGSPEREKDACGSGSCSHSVNS